MEVFTFNEESAHERISGEHIKEYIPMQCQK